MTSTIKFSRAWGMPSADTFDCKPIRDFVGRYMSIKKVSVDPFARNRTEFTHTNDLNPNTRAQHHMEACDFLEKLICEGVVADIVIFDPPYSVTQVSRSYEEIGMKFKGQENPTGGFPVVRRLIPKILKPLGFCLSCGWNSCGMGKGLGFVPVEIMLCCHGGNHNDTICMAEQFRPETPLFQ